MAGNVRIVDRQFVDDSGIFCPLGASLFTTVWMAQEDRAMLDREIDLVVGDFVRSWGEVGGKSWEDRVIDPRRADYEQNLAHALDRVHTGGKRTFLSIFAGGAVGVGDLDMVIDKVIRVCQPRQSALLCIQLANEDNFVGSDDDARRLLGKLKAALPGVPLMPHGEATQLLDVCNALDRHLERTDGDNGWRVCRQAWGLSDPCACAQGEPAGIHLHQNQDVHDPGRMAFMWAVGILNTYTLFCVHTGAGVRSGGHADRELGRPASFADAEMADYPSYAAKCRVVASWLPESVCHWQKTSQRGTTPWPDNFLWADAIWSDGGADHGCSRNYVAYRGNEFVALCFGVLNVVNLKASKNLQGTIYDAYAETSQPFSVSAGGQISLAGNPQTNAAYVLRGTFA